MTDLTTDAWLGGRLTLLQPATGYRVAVDAALLAAAAPDAPDGAAVEFGAGVGAAALAYAARRPSVRVVAIELQPRLAALAARNVAANGLGDMVEAREGDVLAPTPDLKDFDVAFFNPPYLVPEANAAATEPSKRVATVEGPARLADWLRAAAAAVRPGGDVVLIHRADRLADICAAAEAAGVGGLRVTPVWPKAGAPAHRVIVYGRVRRGGRFVLGPGLVLHDPDGAFTDVAEAVLRGDADLPPPGR